MEAKEAIERLNNFIDYLSFNNLITDEEEDELNLICRSLDNTIRYLRNKNAQLKRGKIR